MANDGVTSSWEVTVIVITFSKFNAQQVVSCPEIISWTAEIGLESENVLNFLLHVITNVRRNFRRIRERRAYGFTPGKGWEGREGLDPQYISLKLHFFLR